MVMEALHSMNASTGDVTGAAKKMTESNKLVLNNITGLKESTLSMKDSMDVMSAGAQKVDSSGSGLAEISEKMKEAISEIAEQMSQFTV